MARYTNRAMAAATEKNLLTPEADLDGLLFDEEADALLVTTYANERPACGLAGELDWRFGGAVAHAMRQGAITGKEGELTYIPLRKGSRQFHFFFLGLGTSDEPGKRSKPLVQHWNQVLKSVVGLKIERLGVSQKDVGGASADEIVSRMKGVPLWVIP